MDLLQTKNYNLWKRGYNSAKKKKKKKKKKLVLIHLLYRAIFKWYFQVKIKCYDFFFIKLLGESTG